MSHPSLPCLARLSERAVIEVKGRDAEDFLQKLVSNDVSQAREEQALYATLLTPQGKFLFDFFILRRDETFFLDCQAVRKEALIKRLMMYRLRADLSVAASDFIVAAMFGEEWEKEATRIIGGKLTSGKAHHWGKGWVYVDPRLSSAGLRFIAEPETLPPPPQDQTTTSQTVPLKTPPSQRVPLQTTVLSSRALLYDAWRLQWGLPEGGRDMIIEKTFLLESGIDDLNGIDWEKGCYVGQETTARMKYRAPLRKRLLPVSFSGPALPFETPLCHAGREIGIMRSTIPGRGLALMRLDLWRSACEAGGDIVAAKTLVHVHIPDWADIPAPLSSPSQETVSLSPPPSNPS